MRYTRSVYPLGDHSQSWVSNLSLQSAVIYFIVQYAYESPTARTDGYNGYVYEFSTVRIPLFTRYSLIDSHVDYGFGRCLHHQRIQRTQYACLDWLGVLRSVRWNNPCMGIHSQSAPSISKQHLLIHKPQAIYSVIRPGWFITNVYGNNKFLFTSAYFWLCMPVVICLSFLPRYLAKAYKAGYAPDDLDILRYANKQDPHRDLGLEAYDNTQNSTAPYGRSTARSTSRVGSSSMVPASSRASSVDSRYAA